MKSVGENFLQVIQKFWIELCIFSSIAGRGCSVRIRSFCQIENVDRDFTFGVDQGDGNVAFLLRQDQAEPTQQAGSVLRDHLQNGAVGRGGIVDREPRFNAGLMVLSASGVSAGGEKLFDGGADRWRRRSDFSGSALFQRD